MPPAPTPEHQWIVRALFLRLDHWVRQRQSGEVLFAPLDVLIQKEPLRTRQPDILFLAATSVDGLRRQRLIEIPPDLVVEILSAGETRAVIQAKLEDYAAIGVREAWLVSPEAETVEILRLEEGAWRRHGLYGVGDVVNSPTFPGMALPVEELFA